MLLIIIKIIKQMKEFIQKRDSIISKMSIEKNTLSNKSLDKLSFDFNNLGLKNYNFSVKNSNQKKNFNISFRNYFINKNKKNDLDNISSMEYNYNNKSSIQLNNDKNNINNINNNNSNFNSKKEEELESNDKTENNIGVNIDINEDNKKANEEYILSKNKLNSNY